MASPAPSWLLVIAQPPIGRVSTLCEYRTVFRMPGPQAVQLIPARPMPCRNKLFSACPVPSDLSIWSPACARPQRSRYNCPTGLAVLPMMNIEYRPLEATAMSLALYDTPPLTVSWVLL